MSLYEANCIEFDSISSLILKFAYFFFNTLASNKKG